MKFMVLQAAHEQVFLFLQSSHAVHHSTARAARTHTHTHQAAHYQTPSLLSQELKL